MEANITAEPEVAWSDVAVQLSLTGPIQREPSIPKQFGGREIGRLFADQNGLDNIRRRIGETEQAGADP